MTDLESIIDERLVLNYRMINLKERNNKQDLGVDYSIIISGP